MATGLVGWLTALGTMASAGAAMYGTAAQTQAARRARRDQRRAIAKATAEATAERERLENLDRERRERLRKRGAQLPPSLMTGMSGVTGTASTLKPILG